MNTLVRKKCLQCKRQFKPKKENQKFCHTSCGHKFRYYLNKNKKNHICRHCGKKIKNRNIAFCNRGCQAEYQSSHSVNKTVKDNRIIICKGCSIKFTPKMEKQQFHSKECARGYFYFARYVFKPHPPQAKEMMEVRCQQCGDTWHIDAKKARKDNLYFCTDECKHAYKKKEKNANLLRPSSRTS